MGRERVFYPFNDINAMKGKLIGILVDDFRLYHELVTHLKSRNRPFISLSVLDELPMNVGVLIVSRGLASDVKFKKKVVCESVDDVEFSVNKALHTMKGKDMFDEIVVGVDPGAKPGIAILGDGEVLNTLTVKRPEDVVEIVRKTMSNYPSEKFRIKIGHGDKTNRNRTINSLAKEGIRVEVVNEKSTTKDARHVQTRSRTKNVDVYAAIQIAKGEGRMPTELEYSPTKGELKLIQSRSRAMSSGRISISKELAEHVAKGDMSLKKALQLQSKGKENKQGKRGKRPKKGKKSKKGKRKIDKGRSRKK
jgi:hypothetical protein